MTDGSFALALLGMAQTLRISAPTVVEAAMGKVTRDVCDARLDWWSAELMEEAGIDLHVHGREHASKGSERFVVMSNHQSLYDIPVLFRAVPRSIRMVAKSELFKIPIFGGALRAAEFIELDRGNKERARESLRLAQQRIRSGIHVWIAPEGTRSPTGKLGTFKGGGFKLALETGTRILPVTLVGTRNVLPAKGAQVRKGQRVDVYLHAPIDPRPYGEDRRDELVAAVRASIESSLPEEMRTPAA
jgi:1-acyl-sn-glycerol-3-phosphate acyltransferase